MITVGELAKKVGISIDAIRFYEKVGLLPYPMRAENGYRIYNNESIKHLNLIINAKELGFTLKEIEQIIKIIKKNINECLSLQDVLKKKILLNKIEQQRLKERQLKLNQLLEACHNSCDSSCEILKQLHSQKIPLKKTKTEIV